MHGDASETAILRFAETALKGFCTVDELRKEYPFVCEIPFNSTNKYHLVICEVRQEKADYLLMMKGAPERIIDRCTTFLNRRKKDKEQRIGEYFYSTYDKAYHIMGEMGERVIGLGYRFLSKKEFPNGYEFDTEKNNFPMHGLCFAGLISMIDPPKAGVKNSVQVCRDAGIKVVMVTGDHPITARAIAEQVSIISKGKMIFLNTN